MEKVQEALKIVKSNCSRSGFLKIKNLEIESNALTSEAFNIKLESFEKIIIFSLFIIFEFA